MEDSPMAEELSPLDPNQPIVGSTGTTLLDFWRWAYSDVLSNRNRAVLAEFLVGTALGATKGTRTEWDSWDLEYLGKKIEVKASGYVQSWGQKSKSVISFDIAKKKPLKKGTGSYEDRAMRSADIYVFCVYKPSDITEKSQLKVLDLGNWGFYVVETITLETAHADSGQLSLSKVKKIAGREVDFRGIKATVDAIANCRPT